MAHVISARSDDNFQALEERLATIGDVYSAAQGRVRRGHPGSFGYDPFRPWAGLRRAGRRLPRGRPKIEYALPVVSGPAAQDLSAGDSRRWPSGKSMSVRLFPGLRRSPVQAPLHQYVHAIEDEADPQQKAGQSEDGPVVYGGVYQEGSRDHDAEDGKHARGTEMLVIHLVAPQREHGDVHHYERQEEEHHGGGREGVERVGVAADRGDERQDHEGGEEDGDPRRTAARVDPGEHLGQDILVSHAVDDPGGHDQVDERPVGYRDERYERE